MVPESITREVLSSPDSLARPGRDEVDFDIGGVVGVRLLDAEPGDVATVVRQLGPTQRPLTRTPDVVVRFVDRIEHGEPLTYVAWPDGGFSDDDFLVLRGKGQTGGRAVIPFQDVGASCEVICERTLPAVPHLLAMVNFAALRKGVLPIHASAFILDDVGVLVAGWAKGGKTELLLAAARAGASYVGDEWVYVKPDGTIFGVPEPIRLWGWQIEQLPEVATVISRAARRKLHVLGTFSDCLSAVARRTAESPRGSVVRRAAEVIRRQVYVQIPPTDLFGAHRLAPGARLDRLVLASSQQAFGIRLDVVDGHQVAARMAASLMQEREPFMAAYRQFRFAFPERSSQVVEAADEVERKLLHDMLDGRRAWWVRHEYPVEIDRLLPALRRVVAEG